MAKNRPVPPQKAIAKKELGPLWVRKVIHAILLEDTHLGSGTGGGGLDALVARDRDGRPVIWATHLEGLLREASRMLPDKHKDVEARLFGARGGVRQQAIFTSLYAKLDANQTKPFPVWRSAARKSFENRAPLDETLRAIEFVSKGTEFIGHVELRFDDVAILDGLMKEVGAVGSGRASGAGRIRFETGAASEVNRACAPANRNSRLFLLLRNLDPLSIATTATPDNLIPSLAYIPGRTLVGAMAAWALGEGKRDAAELFVNGSLSCGDALPLGTLELGPPTYTSKIYTSKIEVSPAPLSLQSEKPESGDDKLPWWVAPLSLRRVNADPDQRNDTRTTKKLKRPEPNLFVWRPNTARPWSAFQPLRPVRMRNGRSSPGQLDPDLFAVEQIAERTLFLSEIQGKPEDLQKIADGLAPVLGGSRWLRIGRGGTPVEVVDVGWQSPAAPSTVPAGQPAFLTLTSDLLVRDERLRWLTSLDDQAFKEGQVPGWPAGASATPVIQDETLVHGFNGTARLWRLPAAGIRRGSVYRIEASHVASLAAAAAAGKWLGERIHEGFGRFRVDHHLPGVRPPGAETPAHAIGAAPAMPAVEPEEPIAQKTREWLKGRRALAEPRAAGQTRPSYSQWRDLVSDLHKPPRNSSQPIESRLQPTTAGASGWKHPDAMWVLQQLRATSDRATHATFFVRWLRVEVLKNKGAR